MYLQLGRDYVVNSRDIIGIFDLENTSTSHRTREFLANAQKTGAVVSLSDEIPKSFVLVEGPVETLYLSPLAPASLKRRVERGYKGMEE
ncbi:MAG: DUF370 domain-containing protein [Faecalibacterium sp.]|nr:DUF370 domain-containing protein [Faecalibacterium sp.]